MEDNTKYSLDQKNAVGFIGAGNMAQALMKSFVLKGIIEAKNIFVSAPSDKNLKILKTQGFQTTHENSEILRSCSIIFLSVKPQILPSILDNLEKPLENNPLFISVAAGVTIAKIENMLSHTYTDPKVIRVMPNTPSLVQEGCSAFSLGQYCTIAEECITKILLDAVGISEKVPENMIDGICGLSGSGPAYIYAAIEAMADGAVKMGVPRHIATKFAAQTVRGAATMVLETGKHPGQLKDEVCSPAGTTITAMHKLEEHGFRNALISAVEASATRAKELS